MNIEKTKGGYFYKIYKSGKKKRISKIEYDTIKLKTKFKGKNKTTVKTKKINQFKKGGSRGNNGAISEANKDIRLSSMKPAKRDRIGRFLVGSISRNGNVGNYNVLRGIAEELSEFRRQYEHGKSLIDIMSTKINKEKDILKQLIGLLKKINYCKSYIKKKTNLNIMSGIDIMLIQLDGLETKYNEFKNLTYPDMLPINNENIIQAVAASQYLSNKKYDPIELWDVSNVTNMNRLFHYNQVFNADIGGWDVSSVTNMDSMFFYCYDFNKDIGGWDVRNVTNMYAMFFNCNKFNKDIGDWDVSNVTNMSKMFSNCKTFNQDITRWNTSKVKIRMEMFQKCPISEEYKCK